MVHRTVRRSSALVLAAAAALLAASAPAGAASALQPRLGTVPFPNDVYTVAAHSPTGRRVHFVQAAMPANAKGVHIDPHAWNWSDGFSPGSTLVLHVPGLDNQAAFRRSKLVPITDMARAFDRDQGVVVIDARTGKRQPIWAEVDAQAPSNAHRALLIRPARNFLEGHRYIAALRHLVDRGGHPIAPLRTAKGDAHQAALRAALRRFGVGTAGLYATWDFTVASRQSLSGRALAIRNDAFRQLGDTNLADGVPAGHSPAFKVDQVTDFAPCDASGCKAGQDPDLLRQVTGTFTVPCYLNKQGCPSGATFKLDAQGLPQRMPGNVMQARFVCNIPRAAVSGGTVHRLLPSLYGHGLFGDISEAQDARNVHQLGNENGVLVCATDWSGMASEDIGSAAPALLDLSKFPAIADRLQQGFLNFMYLGRLLHRDDGLASDPAFQIDGQSVVDTSSVAYYGNSQGGILGGALTALSPDIVRSVLYVPGMNYSMLLPRSVDFDDPTTTADFAGVLAAGYPDRAKWPLLLDLAQMLWDRGEPAGYAQHMTSDPLPDTPRHDVLLEMAFGDHQVANATAEAEARTVGARLREPALDPGRSPDVAPFYGIPRLQPGSDVSSAMVVWDIGPLRTQDGVSKGTPAPPTTDNPPSKGQDPHDYVIDNSPQIRRQIAAWLRPGGGLVDVCGGAPCRTPDWAGPGH